MGLLTWGGGAAQLFAMTTLSGADVPAVVQDALELYTAVLGGRWSAAVDVCVDCFADPDAARRELDALAVAPMDPVDPVTAVAPFSTSVSGDSVTFAGDVRMLRSALDLYTRVLLGQFGEVAWATGNGALTEATAMVRATHQRQGAWPVYAQASWSVAGASAPRRAQVAYDAWKLLGGGVAGRPLITSAVSLA